MLEGLDVSVIKFSEVLADNYKLRYDPEFFGKDAAKAYSVLRGHRRFGDLVAEGYRVVYEETEIIPRDEGIRNGLPFFLQAADIETPFIRTENMGCVSRSDWDRYTKGRIVPGELLIEVKGLAEKVALVPDDIPPNTLVTGTCYKMTTRDALDAPLLLAFLISRYGQALKNRLKSNLLVAFVSKEDLFGMPVPDFGGSLKQAIAKCIRDAFAADRMALVELSDAERKLTIALDFDTWQPSEPLTYVRRASEVADAGRFDSIYFSPAKTESEAVLSLNGAKPLSAYFEPIRDMVAPEDVGTSKRVLNFDVGAAAQPVIDDGSPSVEDFESAKKRFQPGDVIISRLRHYLRQIAVIRTDAAAVALGSSEFIVLRPRSDALPQEALVLFLRCLPVQTILKYSQDGSHHPRFSEEDLLAIPVPDALLNLAPKLTVAVRAAHTARREAQALLARAQRAVEVAIEQGEPAAMALL